MFYTRERKKNYERVTLPDKSPLSITNVLDCDGAGLLFMIEGRSSEALGSFAQALREHGGDPAQIRAIAMDMSPAYLKGAAEYFPGAQIIFDKFHVMLLAGPPLRLSTV